MRVEILLLVLFSRCMVKGNKLFESGKHQETTGVNVVQITINKITKYLNSSHDFSLLKRIALVESNFGQNEVIMAFNPNGGIWQISPFIRNELTENSYNSNASRLINIVEKHCPFCTECFLCNEDYSLPLRSALVARIYIEHTAGSQVPKTISEQAKWWSKYYHPEFDKSVFEKAVLRFLNQYSCDVDVKSNVWFLLDGTERVSNDGFQNNKHLIENLVSRFPISSSAVQVGLSVFSTQHNVVCSFSDDLSSSVFREKLSSFVRLHAPHWKSIASVFNQHIKFTDEEKAPKLRKNMVVVVLLSRQGSLLTDTFLRQLPKEPNIDVMLINVGIGMKTQSTFNNVGAYTSRYITLSSFADLLNDSTLELVVNYTLGSNSTATTSTLNLTEKLSSWCHRMCGNGSVLMNDSNVLDFTEIYLQRNKTFDFNCSECADEMVRLARYSNVTENFKGETNLRNFDNVIYHLLQVLQKNITDKNHLPHFTNLSDKAKIKDLEQSSVDIWIVVDWPSLESDDDYLHLNAFASKLRENLKRFEAIVTLNSSLFNKGKVCHFDFPIKHDLKSMASSFDNKKESNIAESALSEIYKNEFLKSTTSRRADKEISQFLFVLSSSGNVGNLTNILRNSSEEGIKIYLTGISENLNQDQPGIPTTAGNITSFVGNSSELSRYFKIEIFDYLCSSPSPTMLPLEKEDVFASTTAAATRPFPTTKQILTSNNENDAHAVSKKGPLKLEKSTTPETNLSMLLFGRNKSPMKKEVDIEKKEDKTPERVGILGWVLFAILGSSLLVMFLACLVSSCYSPWRREADEKDDVEEGYEDKRKREISTAVSQLKIVSLEASQPDATISCMKQLQKLLILAGKLRITSDQLEDSYYVLKRLNLRFKQFLEDLKTMTDDAKLPTADRPCCDKLKEKLAKAEEFHIPADKLADSVEVMKHLETRLTVLDDLKDLTGQVKEPTSTSSCVQDLKVQVSLAESLGLSEEELVESKATLKEVQDRQKILEELSQVGKEAKEATASISVFQKLEQTMISAEQLSVSPDQLKEYDVILEELKTRIQEQALKEERRDQLLRELPAITDRAMMTSATISCMQKLQDTLWETEVLEIHEEKLQKSYEVLNGLKMRINTVMSDLHEITDEACTPTVETSCSEKLKDQLRLAVSLEIPEEDLAESYNALETLKKRMDILKMVQDLTNEANESTATRNNLQELQEKVAMAETLEVPQSELTAAYDAGEKLTIRFQVADELKEICTEAQLPTAAAFCREKLEQKIDLAEQLGVAPQFMKEPNDTLELLKQRLRKEADLAEQIEKACQDLRTLTYEAKLPTATVSCMPKLQEALKVAEALEISHDKTKESYETLEKLKQRVDQVVVGLNDVVDEANTPVTNIECKKKLKEQIRLAESLEISPELLDKARQALDKLKERLQTLKELQECSSEAQSSTANEYCVQKLQEKLNLAEALSLPPNQLKESRDVLSTLKQRIEDQLDKQRLTERALQDLSSITAEAKLPSATMDCVTRIKDAISRAERLGVERDRLTEASGAMQAISERADSVLKALSSCANENRQPEATVLSMARLENQLALAQSLRINSEVVQDSLIVLENMRARVNKCVNKLQIRTEEAKDAAATHDAIGNLQEQILLTERLHIPQEQICAPQDALEALKNRINFLVSELKALTSASKLSATTLPLMDKLEEKLIVARRLKVPQNQTAEAEAALDYLKNYINKFLDDLKSVTDDAKDPFATLACAEKLEKKVSQAEDLRIPAEHLRESYSALQLLKGRGDEVMNDLIDTTTDAKEPNSTFASIKKLEEKLSLAEKLQIPSEKLKDSRETLSALKLRVLTVTQDLKAATNEANDEKATFDCIKNLENALASAKDIHMPIVDMESSYAVLDKLSTRMDTVRKDLNLLVEKTQNASAIVPCISKLQDHLRLAQSLRLPSHHMKEATETLKKLRGRVAKVLQDLAVATTEANQEEISMDTMETLEEKVALAEKYQVSADKLKEAHCALQRLKDRVSTVSVELMSLTSKAKGRDASYKHYIDLQQRLSLAEKLHIPSVELKSSYAAMHDLKTRIDNIMTELSIRSSGAQEKSTFASMVRLQEQLINAADLEIPQSQLQEAYDILKRLKARVNEVMHDLKEIMEEATGPNSKKADIAKLEWQIPLAECLAVPSVQLNAAYNALEELKNRNIEVSSMKDALKAALCSGNLNRITDVLKRAKSISYLTVWDPGDQELFELLKRVQEAERSLIKATKCSAEEVALRNKLREDLTIALEKDFDRKTLQKATVDFQNSLGSKPHQNDKDLVLAAKDTYSKKSKDYLMNLLTGAIKSRKPHNIHNALSELNLALQMEDVTYITIDASPLLKATIERARHMANFFSELENMKRTVVSLPQLTISEIRSYTSPPIAIRKIMEATFLLLGEDRRKVKDWVEIQALIGKMGKESLKRRIVERELNRITRRDVDRVIPLISDIRMSEIQNSSKAAAVFLAWSKYVVQEIQSLEA